MKRTKRVFLVHGWDGRPDNHWFPWLSHKLVGRGFSVFAPAMPSPAHPKLSEWIAELSRVVGIPDEKTYFVGHSLGCIAVVRYIEQLPKRARVGGCVFVAGFSNDLGILEIAEFVSSPFDAEAVKLRAGGFVTIYSDDDEYVPLSESRAFCAKLGAMDVFRKGKGHFSDETTKLSSVLSAVLELAKLEARS